MIWIVGITIGFLAFLLVEAAIIGRARLGIPCRIVVTGTRGKSSLVRILVAGLRASGLANDADAVWGKITGDEPLLLLPDGTAETLKRRGPARLHEQARLLRKFHRQGARCLVLESMTISPEAMVAEMRLVKPTLVVVTNVRDDHRETLGTDPDEQRAAYLAALPVDCRWLTRDDDLLDYVAANEIFPTPLTVPVDSAVPDCDSDNFVVSELLTTAEAVLAALGQQSAAASEAMRSAAEDLMMPPRNLLFENRKVRLLDAFSANDLQSLARLWAGWRQDDADKAPWSVLLATRADRPLRTRQFCDWLAERSDIDTVHVTGSHAASAIRLLKKHGVKVSELAVEALVVDDKNQLEAAVAPTGAGVLVGLGNARGLGLDLRAATCRMEA